MDKIDTYLAMRTNDPISYGEHLYKMLENGLTQTQIANDMKTNRQLVGRYQKIGKWKDELKEYVKQNRRYISNTFILNAAMSSKSEAELFSDFKKLVKAGESKQTKQKIEDAFKVKPAKQRTGELKQFPLSLVSEAPPIPVENINTPNTLPSVTLPIETVKSKELFSWMDLLRVFTRPASVSLLICITGMTSYLIYQGLLFFSFVEINTLSATTNAIISEAIPILSAACLTLCTERLHKLAAGFILIVTIVGLSMFMHTSLAGHMTKQSSQFSRLDTDRNISLESIQTLTAAVKVLPDTFLTKKQQLMGEIQKERDKLGAVNQSLNAIETTQSNVDPISLSYSVWLRIAAMLMNTLLVHLFFGRIAVRNKLQLI